MKVRLALALVSLGSLVSTGCARPKASGLDEAAIQSAAIEPDAPPVTGKVFGAAQKECNAGDAHGCFALGSAFLSGSAETTKDEARSTRLFWKACTFGEPTSCALLGHAFRDGVGGTQEDLPTAKKFYAKACALGHEASCPRAKSANGY